MCSDVTDTSCPLQQLTGRLSSCLRVLPISVQATAITCCHVCACAALALCSRMASEEHGRLRTSRCMIKERAGADLSSLVIRGLDLNCSDGPHAQLFRQPLPPLAPPSQCRHLTRRRKLPIPARRKTQVASACDLRLFTSDVIKGMMLSGTRSQFQSQSPMPSTQEQPRHGGDRCALSGVKAGLEFRLGKVPRDSPEEVCVRVEAVALNFFDVVAVMGAMPSHVAGHRLACSEGGLGVGSDFAGLVTGVGAPFSQQGDGRLRLRLGDEVFGVAPPGPGALSTYLRFKNGHFPDPALCALVPRGRVNFAEAASLPTVALTACAGAVQFAQLAHGETVLIHAASGGAGLSALAVARRLGAMPTCTAGSAKKQCFLRVVHGIRDVTSSRDGHAFTMDMLEASMSSATPSTNVPAVVLNSLTHDDFVPRSVATLGVGGRFLELGKLKAWSATQMSTLRPDVRYAALLLDGRIAQAPASLQSELRAIANGVCSRELRLPPIALHSFPNQVLLAFKVLQQAKHIGKIVLMFECGQGGPEVGSEPEWSSLDMKCRHLTERSQC
ncbi:unnamed protein product [Polarella glacialis]|uniref:Enoyl reductase (ER) domain-containing protein n=1 Tax=Polarella glacialis TaxID=89957 RepID=A0A813EEJ7_POLGL|nr:unnamed protein product [Polarella glacialis]